MSCVRLILVGGFLGAGKTTLLARAAERFVRQGKRVGLITNDQARDLVDTGLLRHGGFSVREVAGGCFCCRLGDLLTAADRLLAEQRPDVLIGEPVGSCTDLSATVLQPLKKLHADRFRVAPFSVLADPDRLRQALDERPGRVFSDDLLYIFLKQLDEADLVVLNKSDRLSTADLAELKEKVEKTFPGRQVMAMSAMTGAGVDEWLAAVEEDAPAGTRIAEVDYDRYADGEAALGWLNATVDLRADRPTDWRNFGRDLLERMRTACRSRAAEVAHAKLLLTAPGCVVTANLTSTDAPVAVGGECERATAEARLIVNARVLIAADALRRIFEECLRQAAGEHVRAEVRTIENFSPSRPQPVYRFREVV